MVTLCTKAFKKGEEGRKISMKEESKRVNEKRKPVSGRERDA